MTMLIIDIKYECTTIQNINSIACNKINKILLTVNIMLIWHKYL